MTDEELYRIEMLNTTPGDYPNDHITILVAEVRRLQAENIRLQKERDTACGLERKRWEQSYKILGTPGKKPN